MSKKELLVRRKHLQFKPEGINTNHDRALYILNSLGRRASDFVASAVIYYAYVLAKGIEDSDANSLPVRFIEVPKKTYKEQETPLDTTPSEKPNPPRFRKKEPDISVGDGDADVAEAEEVVVLPVANVESEEASPAFALINETKSSLPPDMLKSLVRGFQPNPSDDE